MADFTFVKTGSIYVHKLGDDSSYPNSSGDDVSINTLKSKQFQCANKGLDNFRPKRTVQAGINAMPDGGILLIKAGDYQETIQVYNRNFLITEDGRVTLRGNGTDAFGTYGDSGSTTFSVSVITGYNVINARGQIRNATIYCPVGQGYSVLVNNCRIVNTSFSAFASINASNCIFVNAALTNVGSLTGCDIGSGCTVAAQNNPGGFYGNNFRGTISVPADGNGSTGQGSTANKQLSYADHKAEYPNWNNGSYSKSPLFNSLPRLDFTYQSGSPNYTGLAASSVGGVGVARAMYLTDQQDQTGQPNPFHAANGAVFDNLVASGTDFVLLDTTKPGSVTSGPIFIGASARSFGIIDYVGKSTYNEASGGAYDMVPRVRLADGTLAPPFSFFLRWSNANNQPTTDADYDNSQLAAAGAWGVFLFGLEPQIDNNERGNGQPLFDAQSANYASGTYAQMKVIIDPNRV